MIIPAGYAQVTHLFTGDAVPTGAAITYGVENTGAADAADIAVAAHLALANNFEAHWPDSLTLDRTLVKRGPNATGQSAEHIEPIVGDNDVEAAPPNTAYLVSKRTALGGRQGRGRMYLPGCDDNTVTTGGLLSPAQMTQTQGDLDAWFAEPGMFGFFPMVLLHSSAGLAPTTVLELTLQQKVATQRQRLRR
jgi:hypothetical protein